MNRQVFSDRRTIAVLLLIVALCGLGWIQYRFLQKYYFLSKEKYDQQVAVTLSEMGEEIYERDLLSNLISAIITRDTIAFPVGMDSLRNAGTHFYGMFMTDRFKKANLSTSFEYAVMDRITGETYMESPGYTQGVQWVGNYKMPLEGVIAEDCRCAPYLNVRFNRFETTLLGDINPILFTALICFILLIIGFYMLIRILREQKYLHRVRNDFINNLTHEIKTPVFSISLATKILREKEEKDIGQYLDRVEHDIRLLKGHVEKVLELASVENSRQLLDLQQVHLDELIRTTIAEMIEVPEGVSINLDLQAPGSLVMADPVHLKNVIGNLVDNAIKYSGNGQPARVEISTLKDRNSIRIQVRDYGPGIEKEKQEAIFEKFYRIHPETNPGVRGFGLGLSYVRQVIGLMNGSVTLKSSPNEGSTFLINLPVIS